MNKVLVCSICHPSGGIYTWNYSVNPSEVIFSGINPPHVYEDRFTNPCAWNWQMVHEYNNLYLKQSFYPEKYQELQQYRIDY